MLPQKMEQNFETGIPLQGIDPWALKKKSMY